MITDDMLTELRERIGERASWDAPTWKSQKIGNFWRNDFLVRALNEGVARFSSEERWPWLLTLKTGILVPNGVTEVELIDDVDVNRHTQLLLRRDSDVNQVILPEKVGHFQGLQLQKRFIVTGDPNYFMLQRTMTNQYGTFRGDWDSQTPYAIGDVVEWRTEEFGIFWKAVVANTGVIPNIEIPEWTDDVPDYAVATRIKLIPTPNADYTGEFAYYKNPAKLTRMSEPDMPGKYHDGVIAYAAYRAWSREQTPSGQAKAQEAFGDYAEVVRQARADHDGMQEGERVSWGGQPPQYEHDNWAKVNIPPVLG